MTTRLRIDIGAMSTSPDPDPDPLVVPPAVLPHLRVLELYAYKPRHEEGLHLRSCAELRGLGLQVPQSPLHPNQSSLPLILSALHLFFPLLFKQQSPLSPLAQPPTSQPLTPSLLTTALLQLTTLSLFAKFSIPPKLSPLRYPTPSAPLSGGPDPGGPLEDPVPPPLYPVAPHCLRVGR